jgi:hypothetical protein
VEQAVRFLSFRMWSSEVMGNPPFLEMKFFHGLGLLKLIVKGVRPKASLPDRLFHVSTEVGPCSLPHNLLGVRVGGIGVSHEH